jgi:hypothetical protein
VVLRELVEHPLEVLQRVGPGALEAVTDALDDGVGVALEGPQVEPALAAEGVVQALAADPELGLEFADAGAVVAPPPEEVAGGANRPLGVEALGGSGGHAGDSSTTYTERSRMPREPSLPEVELEVEPSELTATSDPLLDAALERLRRTSKSRREPVRD